MQNKSVRQGHLPLSLALPSVLIYAPALRKVKGLREERREGEGVKRSSAIRTEPFFSAQIVKLRAEVGHVRRA